MNTIKRFVVTITTEEQDFETIDLLGCIKDGIENIGNHTLVNVEVQKIF